MRSLKSSVVTTMAAGALLIMPMTNTRATRVVSRGGSAQDPKTLYTSQAKEFWMSADEFGYVRPGFHITVNSITIGADNRPVADVSFTDDQGQPLDRAGKITPGALSVSFILAWWDADHRQYTSYTTRKQTSAATSPNPGVTVTQAGTDSGGTWEDLDLGHSKYTFKTALPAGYDGTVTTTLGIYATRDMINVPGGNFTKNYYANVEQDFVPTGAPVTQAWDMVGNAACNTCHNPLSAHGGSRQDVKLCVLCHQPQTVDPDTGNTVDFKVMIHKIHMGENLPSVQAGTPYEIIGFNSTVVDFSHVAFPQDVRNCATCHNPDTATQAANWFTFPSQAACASCHDDVTFTPGGNHAGGPQADDSHCAQCHQPQGTEFDVSIMGAHTVPFKSTQLKGVKAEIASVTNTAPGQNPTVLFTITQNDGTPIPPGSFTVHNSDGSTSSGLNVVMSGPTTDYSLPPQIRERADGATASGANYSYTFTHAIPADSTGTWAFSIEARLTVTLNPAPSDTKTVRDSAFNPVFYAAVTDPVAVPRRVVVDIAKCNTCHDRLALHGGNRLNPQECVFCHNPNGNDGSEPPESIDFKRMIHRIHTGADLTQDYSIGDNSFNGVLFPGDRRDCQKCHTDGTQQVSETPPDGLLMTTAPRDWYGTTPMGHYTTACLGCHDTKPAAAHAFSMTAPFGEACATCHGPDAEFSVDKMHAR